MTPVARSASRPFTRIHLFLPILVGVMAGPQACEPSNNIDPPVPPGCPDGKVLFPDGSCRDELLVLLGDQLNDIMYTSTADPNFVNPDCADEVQVVVGDIGTSGTPSVFVVDGVAIKGTDGTVHYQAAASAPDYRVRDSAGKVAGFVLPDSGVQLTSADPSKWPGVVTAKGALTCKGYSPNGMDAGAPSDAATDAAMVGTFTVTDWNPKVGNVGTMITVTGTGFKNGVADVQGQVLTLGGATAKLQFTATSDTELQVTVPTTAQVPFDGGNIPIENFLLILCPYAGQIADCSVGVPGARAWESTVPFMMPPVITSAGPSAIIVQRCTSGVEGLLGRNFQTGPTTNDTTAGVNPWDPTKTYAQTTLTVNGMAATFPCQGGVSNEGMQFASTGYMATGTVYVLTTPAGSVTCTQTSTNGCQ
jgi:hypothetical protein